MALSIADQIALDDALVAPADRLKIGKCNLRLSSDVTSKEATLQVVYDVLKLTPFYKAFQVTADAPEIYMQEFWASAYVHNRSVRFKMNNKKHIIGLEQFRDILQICPRVGNKKFVEPPLEKEILIFLASLGHSGDIRKITDVNVNKLHQHGRIICCCNQQLYLSGTPSYDSLRFSQAQILWGMYNKKNVDYAYLLWEDFIFKYENKNMKKGSAMYYPRFTKLVVNYVMEKDPSIPRRNRIQEPIPLRQKGSKKKAITEKIPKLKAPTAPKKRNSGKETEDCQSGGLSLRADLTEAEDDEDAGKNDVDETTQDDEDNDDHDDDKKVQDDDEHDVDKTAQEDEDEEQTESDNDGDDFVHPKLTTHDDEIIHEEDSDEDDSSISTSNDEDSDNEDEGTNVEGAKSD
ncbi:hypothetical protein Tco_0175589 [Tanacetum coccineum]